MWNLDGSAGRQYGSINGDLNPIHLYAWTSRMFGFKRPICHALFLVSKAEAALRNSGEGLSKAIGIQPLLTNPYIHIYNTTASLETGLTPAYPCVLETEFRRPTLLPVEFMAKS